MKLVSSPDPGSKNISGIGGNVSANAGGMSSVRYGVTKDVILNCEGCLADDRLVTLGGRTRPNRRLNMICF